MQVIGTSAGQFIAKGMDIDTQKEMLIYPDGTSHKIYYNNWLEGHE